jgi:hypothetical protein
MTIVIIHLSIHLRLFFIENQIEIYYRINKLNKLIKYKLIRWLLTIKQSLESESEFSDDGTLGHLILSKIYDKINEKKFGSKVKKYYLCQA